MEAYLPKRRKRTIITPEHLEKLESAFECEQWPNREVKAKLADDLGRPETFVNIWFQNKRARVKREQGKRVKALLEKTHGYIVKPHAANPTPKARIIAPKRSDTENQRQATVEPSMRNMTNQDVPPEKKACEKDCNIGGKSAPDRPNQENSEHHDGSLSEDNEEEKIIDVTPPVQNDIELREKNKVTNVPSYNILSFPNPSIPRPEVPPPAPSQPPSLFQSIVRMMAVVEGGILQPNELCHGNTVSNALYGIKLKDDVRLVYDRETGFEVIEDETAKE